MPIIQIVGIGQRLPQAFDGRNHFYTRKWLTTVRVPRCHQVIVLVLAIIVVDGCVTASALLQLDRELWHLHIMAESLLQVWSLFVRE